MRVLYIEPFEGGSHRAFGEALRGGVDAEWVSLTLPDRHWKWRMRGSAVWFARTHADVLAQPFDLIFASSYLPLAELRGLVPALARIPAVLYFHENQLAFPVREAFSGERDTHFGFTQLVSSLAATACVFNSEHNRSSFLDAGRDLLRRLPDAVAPGWVDDIEAKSRVIGLPLALPSPTGPIVERPAEARSSGPLIVWNHRWEHDKGPERFFEAMFELDRRGVPFRLGVCGHRFRKAPEIFEQARQRLEHRIESWGPLERDEYEALLMRAQLVVSTAEHEFFGISMLEGAHFGAHPLVPNRLAYPELFPEAYRYGEDDELVARIEAMSRGFVAGERSLRADRSDLVDPHRAARVCPQYAALFTELAAPSADV